MRSVLNRSFLVVSELRRVTSIISVQAIVVVSPMRCSLNLCLLGIRKLRRVTAIVPVSSICNDESRALNTLVWNVEPRILARYKVGKVENQREIAEGRQEDINRAEAKKARDAEQKKYRQQCLNLIEAFYPTSARGVEFRLMADTKAHLRGYFEKQNAKGDSTNWVEVHKAFSAYVEKAYKEAESIGQRSDVRLR